MPVEQLLKTADEVFRRLIDLGVPNLNCSNGQILIRKDSGAKFLCFYTLSKRFLDGGGRIWAEYDYTKAPDDRCTRSDVPEEASAEEVFSFVIQRLTLHGVGLVNRATYKPSVIYPKDEQQMLCL